MLLRKEVPWAWPKWGQTGRWKKNCENICRNYKVTVKYSAQSDAWMRKDAEKWTATERRIDQFRQKTIVCGPI